MEKGRVEPEDPERVERADPGSDRAGYREENVRAKSLEEARAAYADLASAVQEHQATRPRRLLGRASEPAEADRPKSSDREAPDERKTELSDADRRVAELRPEGHGPQRHLDPPNGPLRDRLGTVVVGPDGKPVLKPNGEVKSRDHIDPMTGTTTDGVHGGRHHCGAVSTAFGNAEDYVKAEVYLRKIAVAEGRPAPEATIEEVLGKEAESRMRGFRHEPDAPGRYQEVDFTGGTIQASYKVDEDGNLLNRPLFPKPAAGS